MATAYIALGANLGDRLATLREAVRRLEEVGAVQAVSDVYETEPVGYLDQPPFLNAAIRLSTAREPNALLHDLLRIEAEMGRVRSFRNAPRSIDLDLLLYDDLVLEAPGLRVPHPRVHERGFVLAPLADIAGNVIHPILGRRIGELWREIASAETGVRVYHEPLRPRNQPLN